MKASQVSFEQMMRSASTNKLLAEATSFIQVEYGIKELQGCWDGFSDSSDSYGLEFESRRHMCAEFASALSEYIEFLEESGPLQVG